MTTRKRPEKALIDRQSKFLERLRARQIELDEGDTKFAARLNISVHLWRKIKIGEQPIHEKLLRGVAANFPDLHVHIIAELAS